MFLDVKTSEFTTEKFKMAAIFKMAHKISSKNQKVPYFPHDLLYLAMQYMHFMLFDMKSGT